MENNGKSKALTRGIIFGAIIVFISIAFANSSKKLTIPEFSQKQKTLDIENSYQNIDTGKYYETLAAALTEVENNQTIKTLNSRTEITAPILEAGKANVKLDMNGQTTTLNGVVLTNNGELDIYNSSSAEGNLQGSGTYVIRNSGILTTNDTSSINRISLVSTSESANARVIQNDVNKSVTLNTNTYLNFTTATTGDRYVITTNGALTVAGANIANDSGSTTASYDRGLQVGNPAGKITITSGTVSTPGTAVIASNVTVGANGTTTIEITGGKISSTSAATVYNNHAMNKVILSGGTITSGKSYAVLNNSTGTLDITGGNLSTTNTQVVRNTTTGIITISGGTITSTSGIGIYNNGSGEISVSNSTVTTESGTSVYNNGEGTINVLGGEINSTSSMAIRNKANGTINVSGGVLSGTHGIYNNASGIINVSGSTTRITAKTYEGIRGNTGKVTVTGGTITSKSDGLHVTNENSNSGSITVTGGTIESTHGIGAYVNGGTLTIGTNETIPSVNTTEPRIIGATKGVEAEYSTFNFYDGEIVGKSGRTSIEGTVSAIPTDYAIVKTYDELVSTEIATLSPENALIPSSVKLNKTSGGIIKGTNLKLQAIIYLETEKTEKTAIIEKGIIWTSSNENIARVDENGIVTGINIGKCQITATTKDGKTAIFDAEVVEKDYVQKAIREVANAYYNRGANAQYGEAASLFYPPEEATPQHTTYSTCSRYVFSTYYHAFDIMLPEPTTAMLAYAGKYYDKNNITTNDVIEYWEMTKDDSGNRIYKDNNGNIKNIELLTENGRKEYAKKLLKEYNLQVGDIISYHTDENTDSGHTLLVYDIIYDENGEPIDAVIRESNSNFEKKTTKITGGLSFSNILNEKNNVNEGTFKEFYLVNDYQTSTTMTRKSLLYNTRNKAYFSILRPLLKDEDGKYTGKYYYATIQSNASISPILGQVCLDRTLQDYNITNVTLNRLKYSEIKIEKTVDVFNNSIVTLGDTLEYTIKITNNSNTKYDNFDIVENIPEYVEIVEKADGTITNNAITWKIQSLEPKQSIEINYRVKIGNDKALLGKEIILTGTVAGIPSGTVTNTISSNLKETQKDDIKNNTQTIIESKLYKGQELISKIYNNSLEFNLNIDELDIIDLIKTRNSRLYYPINDPHGLSIYLNTENAFYKMVLQNYFGALYTDSSGTVFHLKR